MWTGVGVIYLVLCVGVPLFSFLGTFIFGALENASGKDKALKKVAQAEAQKRRRHMFDSFNTMSFQFRRDALKEYPDSVVVGEQGYFKQTWIDGEGWTTLLKSSQLKMFRYDSGRWDRGYHTEANHVTKGHTTSLYEYLNKVEFMDELDPAQWCKDNGVYYGKFTKPTETELYVETRREQIATYCYAVSMLAHRYICFEGYGEFKDTFIRTLIRDKDLVIQFVHECHAANRWKAENNHACDCVNYMKDFMRENQIQEKIDKIAGHSVTMPDDFRNYRDNSPNRSAAHHVAHERAKTERIGESDRLELESKPWWAWVGILTLIGGGLFISVFTGQGTEWNNFAIIADIIIFFPWIFCLFAAGGYSHSSDQVKKEDKKEEYYYDFSPYDANIAGKEFAKAIAKEIEEHSLPYKYYKLEDQEE